MIYFVVKDVVGRYPMSMLLADWGRALAPRLRVIDYDALFAKRALSPGSYVFTDLEYLDGTALENVARCWNALSESGASVRLLNHPLRVKRRFELLRLLHDNGCNDFNVHRLDGGDLGARFPVFLRGGNDHEGPRSSLLSAQGEVDAELEQLAVAGRSTHDWIAVEFADYAGDDGLFRKFGAFNVGGVIIPRHLIFSHDWMTKGTTREIATDLVEEEHTYIDTNPHADVLSKIFADARIDYGRIDYTVHQGRIRVFEINLNPQLVKPGPSGDPRRAHVKPRFSQRFVEAMLAIDCPATASDEVAVAFDAVAPLRGKRDWIAGSIRAANTLGLQRFEPGIFRRLFAVRTFWRHHKGKWWQSLPPGVRDMVLRGRR